MQAGVDAETRASSTALAVGAPSAWARGGDGAGVVVGVLDSGVLATHVELAGRLLRGHDALTGGIDTGDANGHGTHVAGLIAAARDGAGIVGVAPQARLLPVRVFTQGAASDAVLSDGIRWAAARAGILNLSLSAGAPIAGAALRDATAGGALVVVAAGNRGAPHPDWPARFAREAWANGPGARGAIVVVGAVDAQHRIADWSNRAGDTASWFLVAPGVDVLSTWASGDDAHARVSGTSMAAPAVSGAAALLQSLWPRLGPREVAAILLATARDLGAPGTNPVYGRGLLDVEAALRPVGPMTTAGAGGEVPLASTGLRTSPATVALARAAARDGLGVVAFDAYRRDYPSDLGARIVAPLPMQAGRAFDAIDARMARIERSLPGGARMTLQPNDSFTMVSRDAAGELAFGAGAAAHEYFGVAAGLDVVALANPYTALAPRGALLAPGPRARRHRGEGRRPRRQRDRELGQRLDLGRRPDDGDRGVPPARRRGAAVGHLDAIRRAGRVARLGRHRRLRTRRNDAHGCAPPGRRMADGARGGARRDLGAGPHARPRRRRAAVRHRRRAQRRGLARAGAGRRALAR